MTDRELKPCPFCGGEATMRHTSVLGRWWHEYAVECIRCKTIPGYSWVSTEDEAISLWQQREVEND